MDENKIKALRITWFTPLCILFLVVMGVNFVISILILSELASIVGYVFFLAWFINGRANMLQNKEILEELARKQYV